MRYAIFLKEINLSIFSFFSYLRNLNFVRYIFLCNFVIVMRQ